MAVQPLTKTKIVKKITAHPNRFQAHQFKRLDVSSKPLNEQSNALYQQTNH